MNNAENKIKENRVIGARGIGLRNANYNSAFDGNPKQLQDGTFVCSDVATKYADRMFWANSGEKVLIQKLILKDGKKGDKLYAATQEEIIAAKIGDSKKIKNINEVILNDFVDVQNFGATVATKGITLGTTGVVQYTQGINKLEDVSIEVHEILSPYGTKDNKSNKDKKSATSEDDNIEDEKGETATNIGKHTFVDKAMYLQGFTVNPFNLNNTANMLNSDDFKGYKEENYKLFKKAVLCSTTLLSSRSKEGVFDAFAIFINLKKDSLFALNNIHNYIDVQEQDKDFYTIDFSRLNILNNIKDIESIEIFHNPLICEIVHEFNNVEVLSSLEYLAMED